MMQNTNTVVPCGKCLPGETDSDLKHLESFALNQKCDKFGEPCKMTSSCNGGSEIEVSGVVGIEITDVSFHEKGWE